MDIRDLLLQVASTYDAKATTRTGVPGQDLLRSVSEDMLEGLPFGYRATGNGGDGSPTVTPWIGIFDPDITGDPKRGLYLAYIFAADLDSVTLTVQQGVTQLGEELGRGKKLFEHLEDKAALLTSKIGDRLLLGWDTRPDLGHPGWRARAYAAGSVAARRYDIADLPSERVLRHDLQHMASVLQRAAFLEDLVWLHEGPDGLSIGYVNEDEVHVDPLAGFQPKDGSDYTAHIREGNQDRSRRHELLIQEFGPYIAQRHYRPITKGMHPKDLVLHRDGSDGAEWLVEAKVVKDGNPTQAVREAMGQLLEYSYFLYQERGQLAPHLIGLFTEDIKAYAAYLEVHGIASIWKTPGGWAGSASAASWGMVD